MNIAVSGLGRIGRLVVRRLIDLDYPDIRLVAVNSSHPIQTIAHLLKYDTTHRKWNAQIEIVSDTEMNINGHRIQLVNFRDPAQLPWKDLNVDLVVDATGKFRDRESAGKHLASGAKKVIVTAPGTNMDCTIVMGVNDDQYDPKQHHIVSTASCTTNCLAPVLKILDEAYTVKQGWMTTVHAYTTDQNLLDNPHKDLRRARSSAQSIIPTSTGVSKALREVLPHLADRMQGIAVRVPTQDVSMIDLSVQLEKSVTPQEVRTLFSDYIVKNHSTIVGLSEEPLVSSDFIGDSRSAVVDADSILTMGNNLKLFAWYDNEWGYACRVVDAIQYISKLQKEVTEQWSETVV